MVTDFLDIQGWNVNKSSKMEMQHTRFFNVRVWTVPSPFTFVPPEDQLTSEYEPCKARSRLSPSEDPPTSKYEHSQGCSRPSILQGTPTSEYERHQVRSPMESILAC